MRLFPRILATSVAFLFVAASCGSSTGEGPGASAPLQTQAAASKALILQGDTVRSPEGLTDEQKTYLSCVEQSRFPQSSRIVWRFKAIDPVLVKSAVGTRPLTSIQVVGFCCSLVSSTIVLPV